MTFMDIYQCPFTHMRVQKEVDRACGWDGVRVEVVRELSMNFNRSKKMMINDIG